MSVRADAKIFLLAIKSFMVNVVYFFTNWITHYHAMKIKKSTPVSDAMSGAEIFCFWLPLGIPFHFSELIEVFIVDLGELAFG